MDLLGRVGKLFRYDIGTGYCLYSGDLPLGIVLDTDMGILRGKPRKAGTYKFTLKRKCKTTDFTIIVRERRRCAKLSVINMDYSFCLDGVVVLYIRFTGDIIDYIESLDISNSIYPQLPKNGDINLSTYTPGGETLVVIRQSYLNINPDTEYAYTLVMRDKGCIVYSVTANRKFTSACPQ